MEHIERNDFSSIVEDIWNRMSAKAEAKGIGDNDIEDAITAVRAMPTHPGVILREEFITPFGLTQTEVAERLKTTFRTVNEILNGKRNISPDMALRLARFFGTSEELWLNLQDQYDLYKAMEKNKDVLSGIRPYKEISQP